MAPNHESPARRTPDAVARVVVAYAIALVVALIVGGALGDVHPLWRVAGADVAATLVIWVFSAVHRNSSFYDAYWSVAPVPIAFFLMAGPAPPDASVTRQNVVFALVGIWAARLTYNWYRQWTGLGHEDWRYVELRREHGRLFPLVDFFGIHFFPTVLVFLGCLSLWPALAVGTRAFGWLDVAAGIVTAGAIAIEAAADQQLRRFVMGPRKPDAILATGLWAYSRHPNYFGETSFWWGLWLFGLAAAPEYWWTIVGPLAMTGLFLFVSIPMMDERMAARRPGYAAHRKRVSGFVPWFPRR
ncbi:MAG: DUF1295 domain-containing protein [Myxococcales bacterium]|nr:DUF1295 domain-containing protein [Myxococcales bacterium]